MSAAKPRILVVDDEEAILETMTFTFQDDYDVLTASDARRGLEILDAKAPVAAVLTDQRMPQMSGVEFVAEVCKRHPNTVRMILTGFADMGAIIEAINDGHVYAYISKPWEPDHLKQVMKQAVEHYQLTVENERLVADLGRAKIFLEAVMDELDTGALAIDDRGRIQAMNRPVRQYLGLEGDLRGQRLDALLDRQGLQLVVRAADRVADDEAVSYDDVELVRGERRSRLRVATRLLRDETGAGLGRVILLREISHEPAQRRFNEILSDVVQTEGAVRGILEQARSALRDLLEEAQRSGIGSPGMGELRERMTRTLTALENWLDVDDALAGESFPDAQLLQDRMRIALSRWPLGDEVPERVRSLARRVEEYYESGENPKQPVL